jgi:hypothetical protein
VVNHAPHGWHVLFWGLVKLNRKLSLSLHPPCSYTLVPADEDEGAGGDVHYVTVEQDADQSPEGCLSACADEGKPRFIH